MSPASGKPTCSGGGSTALKTAINTLTFAQCWSLDETGNWSQFRSDNDGNGTWDLEQARVSNPVNEIIGLTPPASRPGYSLHYDPAGNLNRIPSTTPTTGLTWPTLTVDEWDALTVDEWDTLGADAYEQGRTFTYDPWNRLVKVSDEGDTVAEYKYDGRNLRILKKIYVSGSFDHDEHIYLSNQNQVLEVRLDSDTDPYGQFVWGKRGWP